jgi:hypothetical protein
VPYHRPPDCPQPPRQPTPERLLWTLHKGTETQSAYLQDSEEFGVELQLLQNGELVYARRHESELLAVEDATAYRQELETDGWIPLDGTLADRQPPSNDAAVEPKVRDGRKEIL